MKPAQDGIEVARRRGRASERKIRDMGNLLSAVRTVPLEFCEI
jgi:hypothetical protein